ncbi:MAG: hypothetical protein HXX17_01535 [Geobacteraceae bacterium]|nr:hypothetical protein [Geobacteraceae bacterium]
MQISTRKFLFLSYYFPPRPEIGGKRVDKLCAVALKRGWQASVVSTSGDLAVDTSLAASVGDVALTLLDRSGARGGSIVKKRVRALFADLLAFMDVVRFFLAARRIKAVGAIPVVMASAPPRRVVVAALLLKLADKNTIFVADFRDPWLRGSEAGKSTLRAVISRYLLGKVLSGADLITATAQATLDQLSRSGVTGVREKSLLIPNAVDLHLFDNVSSRLFAAKNRVIFGHLGDLDYEHRNPVPLLQAVSRIKEESPRIFFGIEVHFWGESGYWQGRDLAGLIQDHGLESAAFAHATVDHNRALGIVKEIDALIIFAFNQPLQIPAKCYEYLLSGKPILALCEEGSETFRLLGKFPGVELVTSPDPDAIRRGVEKIVQDLSAPTETGFTRDLSSLDYEKVFAPLWERIEGMLHR